MLQLLPGPRLRLTVGFVVSSANRKASAGVAVYVDSTPNHQGHDVQIVRRVREFALK